MLLYREAAESLLSPILNADPKVFIQGASIDSRTLDAGNLFVAISTDRSDGHAFLDEAFLKGASGALISRSWADSNADRISQKSSLWRNLILVVNPVEALQKLSSWNRSRFSLQAAAITGSVGKTSTKDFLTYLLRSRAPVLSNRGNLNNHLGIPITLLDATAHHHYLVAEMGASGKGEIRILVNLVQPNVGILTQVSPAHLGGFGSLKDIYDAKTELFDGLPPHAPVILPEHDNFLIGRARKMQIRPVRVGYSSYADYSISSVQSDGKTVSFRLNSHYLFRFPGVATFLAKNAAMAVAAAVEMGLPIDSITSDWSDYVPTQGRFVNRELPGGISVIDDSYNASPTAFESAVHTFAHYRCTGRKILFVADMLELGEESKLYHERLGNQIARLPFDAVIGFGPMTKAVIQCVKSQRTDNQHIKYFENFDESAEYLIDYVCKNDVIMVKGSRGMKTDRVIPLLEHKFSSKAF